MQPHYTSKKPNYIWFSSEQRRHGSSELIRLLHDHGFIVSYDEVIRFRKSATKFVGDSDRSSILHQAMGLSWTNFGLLDNLDLLVSTPMDAETPICHGSRVRAAPIM